MVKMKKIILILIMGILLISLIEAKGTPNNKRICGIATKDKIISYSRNSECFCPNGLDKITVWIKPYCPPGMLCAQYFFPAYSCKNKAIGELGINIK